MAKTKELPHKAVASFHQRTASTLAALKKPTKESVEQALMRGNSTDSNALKAYTGYYSMSYAKGAFLSIDTSESCFSLTPPTLPILSITVTISLDGKTQNTYSFDNNSTFQNGVLVIPGVLTMTLTRTYQDGILVIFAGSYNSSTLGKAVDISGATTFNPIPLSTFEGDYYDPKAPTKLVLKVSNGALSFNSGNALMLVKHYTYIPLMFVLAFSDLATGRPYLIMMGTAGKQGLAAFILGGAIPFVYTIPGGQDQKLKSKKPVKSKKPRK